MTADLGAPNELDDALRFLAGDLDEREPLQDAHVTHRLAIETGRGGDHVEPQSRRSC